jgi:hypothetical protein
MCNDFVIFSTNITKMNPKEYYGGTIEDGFLRSPLIKIYPNNEEEIGKGEEEEIGKNDEENNVCLHKQSKLLLYIIVVSGTITAIAYIIIFSLRHHNSPI